MTITCRACRNAISADLRDCPHCSTPNADYTRQKPLIEMKTDEERKRWLRDAADGNIMRIL